MREHLREALLAMRANLVASVSTLTTMTLTLLMLGFVLLLTMNAGRTLQQLESQVEVAAFLSSTADSKHLLKQVKLYPQVQKARLVSKKAVLKEMTRDYPYAKEAVKLVGNPFPDTLRMRVSKIEDSKKIADAVAHLPGVDGVQYGAKYVDSAIRTLNTVRGAGYFLVGLLLVVTLFNILNAVRVAMYARRHEISVMRLLGATPNFIRMPHLIEGVIVGSVASLLAIFVLATTYLSFSRRVAELVPVFPIVTSGSAISGVLFGLFFMGVSVGVVGSFVATGRYLKELE